MVKSEGLPDAVCITDIQLGFGHAHPNAFDRAYGEIYRLQAELARLKPLCQR